ncbi:MAG: NAD(P)/FAD-dependent oxidoreductase [Xanthobacteraceae bacterium]
MTVDTETFVIGAGPAGLTAAYCLAKAGRSVTVVERDPHYVGGISRTVEHNGFLFDIGGHRFFSKSQEVVALWHELLPGDFIERPRLSRIYYNGQFFSYPLKAFEALVKLGVFTSAACLMSYARAKLSPVTEPRTFHQWVRNQFGERLFQIFFKTYTEKVWGMSCDDISADWAAQRIKGLDLAAAVANGLARSLRLRRKAGRSGKADADTVKTLIESFQYPRKGPGMMWQAAASRITALGGRILMGRELLRLEFDAAANCWRIEIAAADGRRETSTARHVISSAPLRELVERIRPTPLSLLHARTLRYRDFLTVALMVRKPDLFADNWIYIHDPRVKVGRVQNFRSWSPEMVPDGMSCLGLEYFCFEGDGLWDANDADLIDLASKEAAQIGLISPADVVDGCVVRQPKAYPVYDEGYRENVAMIRLDLEGAYPTLHLVGRNGMHKYNNQDHAMMTAMLSARNILAGERLYDTWNVNEDAEYHEAGGSGVREALGSTRLVPQKAAQERAA